MKTTFSRLSRKSIIALLLLLVGAAAVYVVATGADRQTGSRAALRTPSETLRGKIGKDEFEIFPLPDSIRAIKNIRIPLNDGTTLSANLYLPANKPEGRLPVVVALTSYGKDLPVEDYLINGRAAVNRAQGARFGNFKVSDATPFEGPDPAYWVPAGYAVLHVDAPGTGMSEGKKDPISPDTVDNFAQAVTWASQQSWSSGKVGLAGTSYLAIIQWLVAARSPQGLTAIAPWEGLTDPYRDGSFHGGIPETAFVRSWLSGPGKPVGTNEAPEFLTREPMVGLLPPVHKSIAFLQYFSGLNPTAAQLQIHRADLAAIKVPTLVGASWSMQGLHTRGEFNGFTGISSTDKWLYVHGRHEWDMMNSPEVLELQRQFFDRFLKGDASAFLKQPRVQLEVRQKAGAFAIRQEDEWPIARTQYVPLYLNARSGTLEEQAPASEAITQYESTAPEGLVFKHLFTQATEVTGHTKLRLWVNMDKGLDMDIFVGMRKRNAAGQLEYFENWHQEFPVVSRGWLRVSQRKTDSKLSKPWLPYLAHDEVLPVVPGEKYPVDIEILPSSTLFETGSTLELVIQGRDLTNSHNGQHKVLKNQGRHTVWTGGAFDSHLLLPVIPVAR
jgi:putative CocE/NonD family hydrolase